MPNRNILIKIFLVPSGIRIAQLVGLTSTAFLAGHLHSLTVRATPALLQAPAPLLVRQWKALVARERAESHFIIFACSGLFWVLANCDAAYPENSSSTVLNGVACLTLLLTGPYSHYLLDPVAKQLDKKAEDLSSTPSASSFGTASEFELVDDNAEVEAAEGQTVHQLLDRWATLNLGRAVMVGFAGTMGLSAVLVKRGWRARW